MIELIEIYDVLYRLCLCNSQREFSEKWLGRSRSYLSYLVARNEIACPTSVLFLHQKIRNFVMALVRKPDEGREIERVRWAMIQIMFASGKLAERCRSERQERRKRIGTP